MINKKLGFCPYCESDNYSRENLQLEDDFVRIQCNCNNCGEDFTEYFGLDEIFFRKKISTENKLKYGEEIYFTTQLSGNEREIIKKALNLLIEKENDTEDYTSIFNKLNDLAIEEDLE